MFIASFAYLFYIGIWFTQENFDEEENGFLVEADQINICIFATVFGALAVGTAGFFGPDYGKSCKAAERVFEVLEYKTKIDAIAMNENPMLKDPTNLSGKIEFKNVWFRYPYDPDNFVLRGASFVIEPNDDVCIVGDHDSGKTAILDLIMRFYDPDFGEVLLDGVSITSYKLHPLRKKVSVVLKQPKMFNYSILDNILYGDNSATNESIKAAVATANAEDFVNEGIFHKYDFTAASLLSTMKANEPALIAKLGQEKYE